jgi:hypothetical protein
MNYYECIGCGQPVTTGSRQTLMLYRYGMTTWVHVAPWDYSYPEECRPRHASPDFDRPV